MLLIFLSNGEVVPTSTYVAARAQVHLAQALLHLIELWGNGKMRLAEAAHMALALQALQLGIRIIRDPRWSHLLELVERRSDAILLNDAAQLILQIPVQLVVIVAFLLGVAPIVNSNFLVRVVELPILVLILFIEVNDEQWVFEVDKEVPHVSHFLGLFLISDDVEIAVAIFVRSIYLLL